MEKYKCNSCGNQFDGDDIMLECPSCNSNSISSVGEDSNGFNTKNFLQENMKVSIILGVVILIISIMVLKSCDGDEKDAIGNENLELELVIVKKDNYLIIRLIDKNTKKDNIKLEYNNNSALYSSAGFEAYYNSNKIVIAKGIIYPCNSGTIKLLWRDDFGGINYNSKIIKFELKNNAQAHEKALCKEMLEINVLPDDCECKLVVISNYDSLYPRDIVMISITGRYGEYKNQKEWILNKTENKNMVFAYVGQSDTIQANGFDGKVKGCESFNIKKYKKAVINYANNPQDSDSFNRLKDITKDSFKLLYKGVVLGDIDVLGNKLRTVSKNNNNATFNVSIEETNKGKCKNSKSIKSVNFTMK